MAATSTVDSNQAEKSTNVNINVGCQLVLLGKPLTGIVKKEGKGDGEIQEFLVMPTPGREGKSFTIVELVNEIVNFIKGFKKDFTMDVTQIESVLSALGLKEMRFSLTQCFIYYKKQGTAAATMEYALGVSMDNGAEPKLQGFDMLKLEKLYLNVWSTERANILETMKVWNPSNLIA